MIRTQIKHIDTDRILEEAKQLREKYIALKEKAKEYFKKILNLEERAKKIHEKATAEIKDIAYTIEVEYKIKDIVIKKETFREELRDIEKAVLKAFERLYEILNENSHSYEKLEYNIEMYKKELENIERLIKDLELDKFNYDIEKARKYYEELDKKETEEYKKQIKSELEKVEKKLEEKNKELEEKRNELRETNKELNKLLSRIAKDFVKDKHNIEIKENMYATFDDLFIDELYKKLKLLSVNEEHYYVDDTIFVCVYKDNIEIHHEKIKIQELRAYLLNNNRFEDLKKIVEYAERILNLQEEIEKLRKEIENLESEKKNLEFKLTHRTVTNAEFKLRSLSYLEEYIKDVNKYADKIENNLEEAKKLIESLEFFFSS